MVWFGAKKYYHVQSFFLQLLKSAINYHLIPIKSDDTQIKMANLLLNIKAVFEAPRGCPKDCSVFDRPTRVLEHDHQSSESGLRLQQIDAANKVAA
jgi:hypothetical protein